MNDRSDRSVVPLKRKTCSHKNIQRICFSISSNCMFLSICYDFILIIGIYPKSITKGRDAMWPCRVVAAKSGEHTNNCHTSIALVTSVLAYSGLI